MQGLIYQLKSVLKDKFCMMSFFLPVIVALGFNFIGTIDLSSVAEFHFGVSENALPDETISWLERYGSVTVYKTEEELTAAINDPSTNVIGVEAASRQSYPVMNWTYSVRRQTRFRHYMTGGKRRSR